MTRLAGIFLMVSLCAHAQIRLGVEAGIPLTNTLSATQSQPYVGDAYSSNTKLLLIGPSLSFGLPAGFRLEAEALYQRVNYEQFYTPFSKVIINFSETFSHSTADRWQFPLLLQYNLKTWRMKPFIEAGPSFSLITNPSSVRVNVLANGFVTPVQYFTNTITSTHLRELAYSMVPGAATGVGLDFHAGRLHVRPEFRYTRWMQSQFSAVSENAFEDTHRELPITVPSLSSKRDQVAFLIGIVF